MGFETVLRLAESHYGNYPGPTKDTHELAEAVSQFLCTQSIREPGVIGVAKSDAFRIKTGAPMYYLGFSPALQRELIHELGGENHKKSVAHFALGKALEKEVGVTFILCWKVSETIIESVKFNFGCAEKKIVTAINFYKETMTEISVVPHPPDTSSKLDAYIVSGGSDGYIIAPCKSCLSIKQ